MVDAQSNVSNVAMILLKAVGGCEIDQTRFASVILKAVVCSNSHWSRIARSDACQGFPFPCLQDGDTRGTTSKLEPHRPFTVATEISSIPCFSHSCLFAHVFPCSTTSSRVIYTLPRKNVPTIFLLSKRIYLCNRHCKKWPLSLHEPRQVPVADTTGSRAAFPLLFRANGQRTDIDVHELCDNTFTSSGFPSAS